MADMNRYSQFDYSFALAYTVKSPEAIQLGFTLEIPPEEQDSIPVGMMRGNGDCRNAHFSKHEEGESRNCKLKRICMHSYI